MDRSYFTDSKNLFDEYTVRLVNKLISQHVIDEIDTEISVGKEAVVYKGKVANEIVAIKIFRVKSCNFKKIYDYISQDPKFSVALKNKGKIFLEWVKREFRNMLIAYRNNVSVPRPIAHREYVIVMEFIGDDMPARQLKNHHPQDPENFFKLIIDNYKRLVLDGKIVHGDLSEFNILNYRDIPVFIDFSQGTEVNSSLGLQLMKRDIEKICRFFSKFFETDENKIYFEILDELKKRRIL
ncbi:MAG: RIO1 family regulatory kinase/ATPase [Candidatus Woesearchaeota archaeon]